MSNTQDYSQKELDNLKESIKKKISAHVGVPITPTSFQQIETNFKGKELIVDNYPVKSIHSITINDNELTKNDYVIDNTAGIIYFKKNHRGFLVLNYICCISEEQIMLYIDPLVFRIFH